MWIAAHPDDEVVIAPLLSYWCQDLHARCTLLVLTRGEGGVCLKAEGCAPDIATVRSGEAGASSQYFGADLILLSLPDGGGSAPPVWSAAENMRADLVVRISSYIRAAAPDLVLTFDPRHGTTCHPDHRALGAIVLDAVKLQAPEPLVYLLESRVTLDASPFAIRFAPAIADAAVFNANQFLAASQSPAWTAVSDDMRRHASQFDAAWINAAESVPPEERAVFIAPARSALAESIVPCP